MNCSRHHVGDSQRSEARRCGDRFSIVLVHLKKKATQSTKQAADLQSLGGLSKFQSSHGIVLHGKNLRCRRSTNCWVFSNTRLSVHEAHVYPVDPVEESSEELHWSGFCTGLHVQCRQSQRFFIEDVRPQAGATHSKNFRRLTICAGTVGIENCGVALDGL